MTVAEPPPSTTDFVALIYLPRIQDTSLQILAAEQRVEGERLGRGFRGFSVSIICQLSHSPVWLVNDAGKVWEKAKG